MSGIVNAVIVVGLLFGAVVVFQHRDEILGPLGLSAPAPVVATAPPPPPAATSKPKAGAKTPAPAKAPAAAPTTGDKYAITPADNKLGPRNSTDNDHGPDKGYGFSKDGGPVEADGFTADEGEPRVGDNRNNKSMTIAQLPGPCETKPYKGKVQYRYKNLSASTDTCVHAKQYYLYKYGIGGVNPIPGTGGEGIREGGAKTGKVVPERKVTAGAKYAVPIKQYNAFFTYSRVSI